MPTLLRPWSSPGPVAEASFRAWGPVNLVMGPPGSGKTGMLIMKALAGAQLQKPWADGVRRARLGVFSIDYRRLWGNFLPSWFEWLPQHDPENGITWTGARGGPALQVISMKAPNGDVTVLETLFMAIGDDGSDEAMEALAAGLQLTWAWFNEWQNMPRSAWVKIGQRVGRYPRAADAPVVAPGRWGDLNAGIIDSWQHTLWTSGQFRRGVHLFEQPAAAFLDDGGRVTGFNPAAENLKNLVEGYYQLILVDMPEHEIERKLGNRWGRRLDGEPVFSFDDRALVAHDEIKPDYRRQLLYGVDAGLDPALVFGQRMADGQLRRLACVVASKHGVGPKRFGEAVAALLATPRFAPFVVQGNIRGFGDPAAFHGHDKEDPDDAHWMDRFALAAGLVGETKPKPAPTNLLTPRLQAVRDTLAVEEGVPRSLFDPVHCKELRRAYNGRYRFRKLQVSGDPRYDLEPEKNDASHVADADQYLALMEGGYAKAIGKDKQASGNAVMELMRQRGLIGGPHDERRGGAMAPLIIR